MLINVSQQRHSPSRQKTMMMTLTVLNQAASKVSKKEKIKTRCTMIFSKRLKLLIRTRVLIKVEMLSSIRANLSMKRRDTAHQIFSRIK